MGANNQRGISRWASFRIGIFLVVVATLVSCQSLHFTSGQQSKASGEADSTYSQEKLRQLFEDAYESISNQDSLMQAHRYLQRIDPNAAGRQWYYETLSEICYYIGTFTDISADSSKLMYDRGRKAALTVLQTRPDVQHLLAQDVAISVQTVKDTLPYIPENALYWWSINSLLWTEDEPPLERVVARQKLDRAIALIAIADPEFRYGAVQRLRGLLLTISPDGDLNQAKEAFEQAVEENGAFWTNHFLYGRYYGITLQNRMIFRTQMQEVVDATNTYPLEFAELNQLVKKRAQALLESEDTFFSASIKFGMIDPSKNMQ